MFSLREFTPPATKENDIFCGLKPFSVKKNQNGRSMIEMLGVLAIIGVLSIGGLSAYTFAMNKVKANRALNDATLIYAEATYNPSNFSNWTTLPLEQESTFLIQIWS